MYRGPSHKNFESPPFGAKKKMTEFEFSETRNENTSMESGRTESNIIGE